MNKPIRVLVWGPGGLGKIAIREVVRHPSFDLAGVLAYNPKKDGVDAAELAGLEAATGVAATVDAEAALAIDCDVVLHLARDFGRYGDVDRIAAFLRAGRNVVTVHPFQHPAAMHLTAAPGAVVERLESAAADGGSTFHSTGIHPGWVADRLAPTASGICTDLQHVLIYENWDMSQFDARTLDVIGFGRPPADMEGNPAVAQMTDNYCLQNLYGLATGLSLTLVRTERTHEYATAPRDLSFWSLEVPEGTVGRLTHTWHGFIEGSDAPTVSAEVNWFLGREDMVPAGFDPRAYYGVRIEGTPSLDLSVAISHSLTPGPAVPDAEVVEPGYVGVIGTCLQAVPYVVAAPSGWLGPLDPFPHWTPGLARPVA